MSSVEAMRAAALAAVLRARRRAPARPQTEIELFFPVPVDGKLARDMTRPDQGVQRQPSRRQGVTAVYTGTYDETLSQDARRDQGRQAAGGAVHHVARTSCSTSRSRARSIIARRPDQGRRHDQRQVHRASSCRRCMPTPWSTARSMACRSTTRRRCSITTSITSRKPASIRTSRRRPGPSWSTPPRS